MAERFQKVTTSQVHQFIFAIIKITLFHKTQIKKATVSAKTFTAYLFVYELANYSSAIFFR